jgi:hypothetical protein
MFMKRLLPLLALLLAAAAAPARAVTTYTLTLSTAGGPVDPAAIITSSPSGITCPGDCDGVFDASSTVVLTQVAPSTMAFVGWTAPCRSNLSTCSIKMMANTSVTATYAPILALYSSGNGMGTVTITSQPVFNAYGRAGPHMLVVPYGTTLVMTAATGTYSAFNGWTGSGGCSTASTCTVTMSSYTAIIATFTATGSTMSLAAVVPLGGGTVTSSPAGISCSLGVCVSTFTTGASVTLTTAATSGYYFAGWANGGCLGKTPCVVVSSSPLQGLGRFYSPAAYFFPNP